GGDGGPATLATLANPVGIAVGRDGSIYIGEEVGGIRQVTPDGIIHTIAGKSGGACRFSGDGGPATEAEICRPRSVAVGADNTIYFLDSANNRVRYIRGGIIN